MTTKTFKVLFFVALIAAIAIPASSMDFATGQEQITKQKLRIEIPQDSPAKIVVHERAMALFAQKDSIQTQGAELKAKYDAEGPSGLTSKDIASLDRVHQKLIDVNLRIDQMNADARALITLTQLDREALENNHEKIRTSNIPFTGLWTDENSEAVGVGFESQEEAEKYVNVIETLIDVPFYVEVRTPIIVDTCASLTSDCNPLIGGIKITTQYNSAQTASCSYSTAVDRNVWWWVDYGFITAAHCFESASEGGADVWQPSTTGKIGDMNMWKYDSSNASVDTAFVKKSGSETHAEAAYNGAPAIYYGGFANPAVNDYVTIVGYNSGVQTSLQVDSITYASGRMTDMIDMDNWATDSGDSGGPVHADGSDPNYHGVIHGHTGTPGSTGHTIATKWSNIDSHFGFNQ